MRKIRKTVNNIILLAAVALLLVSIYKIVTILGVYRKAEQQYDKMRTEYVTDVGKTGGFSPKDKEIPQKKKIDWSRLLEDYPHVVAWIDIPAIEASYPVMQFSDNTYYLDHSPSDEYLAIGSLFLDAKNAQDFSEEHSIIYGHNLRSGKMFGALKRFATQKVYDSCKYFWVYTPKKDYLYQIFSVYETDAYSDTYELTFDEEQQFSDWIAKCCKKNEIASSYPEDAKDEVITLSTCSGGTHDSRRVVQAVRILEETNG